MVKKTISAGGMVLRRGANGILLLVVELDVSKRPYIDAKWAPFLRQLPKGGQLSNESLEQTALREVLEETGCVASIIAKAGKAQWSYERDGNVWNETVHYYYMVPVSQNIERDQEFDAVLWMELEQARKQLSYPEERELVRKLVLKAALLASIL